MLKGAHPSDHIQACLTAARTFRVGADSAVMQPSSAQASASGQVQRVTLIEGPSFEFPQNWRVMEDHGVLPGAPPTTRTLSAGNGNVLFRLKHTFPQPNADIGAMRTAVADDIRRGTLRGVLDDFEVPGARGFAVHDAETGSVQEFWYYWLGVGTTVWAFECTEMAVTVKGQCESAMRSFRNR
jgi:hypothetical protein